MTTVSDPPEVEPATPVATDASDAPDGGRWRAVAVPLGVCLLVAALALIPLLGNRTFYFWDDSAAQFVPMWNALGERILEGNWPPLLDLDAWMGGNLAAEALFGVWNPVNAANYVLVASLGDLAVAGAVVKTEFLVLLALGVYLLCREYGAARWSASVIAVALPFSGFTLYFEASTWAAGLMAFTWVPYVWWSVRRSARGRMLAVWPFLFGGLAITAGNPYGLLAVCVVFLGLLVEFALRGQRRAILRVLLVGLTMVGFALLVFLPLLGNSSVSWRGGNSLRNDRQLVPTLSDVLNMSMPSFVPSITSFAPGSIRMTVPATYFAWFVLPLAAWLDWGVLRRRWRSLAGALVVGGCYLAATVGPSNLWMFRWPLRLVECVFLGLGVVLAVVLGAGLRTDHARRRIAVTALVILVSGYLAFAAWPKLSPRHLVSMGLLALLTATAVVVFLRARRWLAVALHGGTVVTLLLMITWFPGNRDVTNHDFPHSVAAIRHDFAERYQGTTFQIADPWFISNPSTRPAEPWRDVLFGNMYRAAGVASTTAYTGMGNRFMAEELMLTYLGGVHAQAKPPTYERLTRPTPVGPSLADLMRVNTIVVQRPLLDSPPPPAGWRVAERNDAVTVLRREAPLPWPDGRLSFASANLRVTADVKDHQRTENVRFERSGAGQGQLVFARLAWPGYTAQVNGVDVPVRTGPGGLVVVDIPDGVRGGELRLHWSPPGVTVGLVTIGAGLLVALALSGYQLRSRRHPARFGVSE
ncbi:hypothetical protein LX15_001798 [Streptoalloteichus tenebrarius]|uniref:YfhO family protein n=1 Tax=Streptoalloteichus tenebrarius (strain ATCC 17920 / DSM 40477 / JCM 4838 / CBS 697.72 / NBRC 16177 / NCIMB 11028 / NRRL B-12390 / A12253. 1 / ISP 5477) TaxID=1933 RepID=A0ABT1HRG7_STRSD|nr:hypothetical protein [Streptoalloteichus tenebrarius]MCP2258111.1 hypothetical protein [Streptoalloteichus tenebrarius]BFF01785.1 hypothetical protein GCM10020241_34600 [Streptoalloteichus tenebrarius]